MPAVRYLRTTIEVAVMSDWIRVSKRRRCPICGRSDWCLVAVDGTAVICPRVTSMKQCGDAGWLHQLTHSGLPRRSTPHKIVLDAVGREPESIEECARELRLQAVRHGALGGIGNELGLEARSLSEFGVGWCPSGRWSSWPMYDHRQRIVGINRRYRDGRKRIIPGHKAGLYLPTCLSNDLSVAKLPVIIAEGATDAVVASELGFTAIGRFSCSHGRRSLKLLMQRLKPDNLAIVADNDEAGTHGANSLAIALLPCVRELKIIAPPPPHKDLRAWRRAGATWRDVMNLVDATLPVGLKVEVRQR